MADKRWKRHEREVAAALGTRRNPNNGERRSDIDAGPWCIEHKVRKKLPGLVTRAMEQITAATPAGKTPIVILSEAPGKGDKTQRFVLVRWQDWVEVVWLARRAARRKT